jgi:uncharacterized integral membrane protein
MIILGILSGMLLGLIIIMLLGLHKIEKYDTEREKYYEDWR